jgi:ParB-like chromosome segregation protein Spo0J
MKAPLPIPIDEVRLDGDCQPRAAIDNELVAEYAETLNAGGKLPAILVYHDGCDYWLADGFHRYHASKRHGAVEINAIVEQGDKHGARWAAAAANQTHGKRRTNPDKRRAVEMALAERPNLSDRAIAEHVGVTDKTVAAVRCGNSAPASRETTRTGKDQKTYTMPDRSPERDEGKPSAKPKKQPALVDSLGIEIPSPLLPLWARRGEVQDLLTALIRVKSALTSADEQADKLFHGCNPSQTIAHLERAYAEIAAAKPWCVCPMCQGDGCRLCGGRGLLGEHYYKHAVPEKIRASHEKQGSKRNE